MVLRFLEAEPATVGDEAPAAANRAVADRGGAGPGLLLPDADALTLVPEPTTEVERASSTTDSCDRWRPHARRTSRMSAGRVVNKSRSMCCV
jgi:hypothetical protein